MSRLRISILFFCLAFLIAVGGSGWAAEAPSSPASLPAVSASLASTAGKSAKTSPDDHAASSPTNAPNGSQPKNQHAATVKQTKTSQKKLSSEQSKIPPMLIVVTPTQMPQPLDQIGTTTSVVTRQQMQSQHMNTAVSALRQVPGVQVVQSGSPGSIADVLIRGGTAAQTLIMLDGVPINNATTDSFDISRFTTDDLSRIEVVRGAGGSLYGSQAIGGVVNLITREGSGPLKMNFTSEGGNASTQRQALTLDGSQGKLAYSGALSYFSTEGYRKLNDNSDYLAGVTRLDYHLDEDTTLRAFAHYIRSNVSLPNLSNAEGIALNPTAHQREEFMFYKGEIDQRIGTRLTADLSGYFVRDDYRLNATPFTGSPSFESDHIPNETRGAILNAVYRWTQGFRSLLGFDFKDRWAHSKDNFVSYEPPPVSQFLSVYNARRQEYAGYVEQEASLFDGHLHGTGGFRVDGNTQFGEEVSSSWAVAIPIQRLGLTLRGSYAEGFRAPSFDELYFPGFGNPELRPEVSSEYDGGFTKHFGERMSLTATYFSRRVHSLITTIPCSFSSACPYGALPGNIGRVDTQGVEVAPSVHPMRGLTFTGSVTVIDQTHSSSAENVRPLLVPKYSAEALAQYTHHDLFRPGDDTVASLGYVFVGDREDITTTSTIGNLTAYHLFDLTVSYSPGFRTAAIRGEQFFARVQNLFDRHYSEQFGFPSPPINFVAGVKVSF